MERTVIGIDPGQNGGIAVMSNGGVFVTKMPATYADIYERLRAIKESYANPVAFLEKVGQGIPGQSSSATATLARHCGHLEMALFALGIATEEVTPQKWQKFYSNQIGTSRGLGKTQWKNRLKLEAQRRFPSENVTLWSADALLIAEYGKHQINQ